MKMKKSLLSRVLIATIIVSVFVSCFVISSSADTSTFNNPTPYYLDFHDVQFPEDYTGFLDIDFLVYADDTLYQYNSIYINRPRDDEYSVIISFLNFDNPSGNPQIDVYDQYGDQIQIESDFTFINVIGDTSPFVDTVLQKIGVKGFRAGTYVFNPSPLFYVDQIVRVDTSEFTSNADNGSIVEFSSLSYYGTPSFSLSLNGTYAFVSSEGFKSGWDGLITFTQSFFIENLSASQLMRSCFTPYVPPSASPEELQEAFDNGFKAGQLDPDPDLLVKIRKEGFDAGLEEGKDIGFQNGLDASDTEIFAENLLGDTLQKPFSSLMNIELFTTPGGTVFTFGTLFGSLISLMLLLIFLKMFAGG